MNAQNIMTQISNNIIDENFNALQPQDSENNCFLKVSELIQLSMKKKIPASFVSAEALDKAMNITIKEYFKGELLLPELISRAAGTSQARDILIEYTDDAELLSKGKVVLATIYKEDKHWRKTVNLILKALGFETIDLGNDVATAEVVRTVKSAKPDVLAITIQSATMPPEIRGSVIDASTPLIQELIDKLSEAEVHRDVKIVIGGYIAGIQSTDIIGTDYCCENIWQAIALFDKLYNLTDDFQTTPTVQ